MNWLTSNAGILCTFMVFAAVLLVTLVGSGGHWKSKAPLILIVPFLAFLVVASINEHQGWPLASYPPNRSIVIGEYIVEPNPATGDAGSIFITAFPPGETRPREYRIPFSRQAEHALLQGKRVRRDGGVSVFKREKKTVKVYKLPPAHLPSKGDRQ